MKPAPEPEMVEGREVLVAAPGDATLPVALVAALSSHGWVPHQVSQLPAPRHELARGLLVLEDDTGRAALHIPSHLALEGMAAVGSSRSLTILLQLAGRGAEVLNQSAPFATLLHRIELTLSRPIGAGSRRTHLAPLQRRLDERSLLATLSGAETEVLHQLAEGSTAPEIARTSSRSLHTVRSHVRSVRTKLGVSSQLAAVAMYWRTATEADLDGLARFTTFGDAVTGIGGAR